VEEKGVTQMALELSEYRCQAGLKLGKSSGPERTMCVTSERWRWRREEALGLGLWEAQCLSARERKMVLCSNRKGKRKFRMRWQL
jgi:hypothetical protein